MIIHKTNIMQTQVEKTVKETSLEELKKFINDVAEKNKKNNEFKPERLKYLRKNNTIGKFSSGLSN